MKKGRGEAGCGGGPLLASCLALCPRLLGTVGDQTEGRSEGVLLFPPGGTQDTGLPAASCRTEAPAPPPLGISPTALGHMDADGIPSSRLLFCGFSPSTEECRLEEEPLSCALGIHALSLALSFTQPGTPPELPS